MSIRAGGDDVRSREGRAHGSLAGRRAASDIASWGVRVGSCGGGRRSGRRLPESSASSESDALVLSIRTSSDQRGARDRGLRRSLARSGLPESSSRRESHALVLSVRTSGDQSGVGARGRSLVEIESRHRSDLGHRLELRSLRRGGRLRRRRNSQATLGGGARDWARSWSLSRRRKH